MILKDFHFQRMEAFYFDKQLTSQNFSQRQQQPSLKPLPTSALLLCSLASRACDRTRPGSVRPGGVPGGGGPWGGERQET